RGILTCGSHAESAATSDKTRLKTAEGPSLHGFISWEIRCIWFCGWRTIL
ncbi:Os06g0324000, partial [Oryza sativa Japonica Group]